MRHSTWISLFLLSIPSSAVCDQAVPWTFYTTTYGYIVFEDDDFVTVVGTADHGLLHLEARYNYEDLRTASVWVGANFQGGSNLTYELTVMGGVAFGRTDGVAPGFRGALYWNEFDLSSEGEYLFDADDRANDFFYSWSELGWSPNEVVRTGFAAQRTKVYLAESDIQLGAFVGGARSNVDVAVYVFEPGTDDATIMLLAGIAF